MRPISMGQHIFKGLTGVAMAWLATYSILEGWSHAASATFVSVAALWLLFPIQPPASGLALGEHRP